jgi:radical SAM protein with 4Fe4S-binding SPASM domain
MVEYALDSHKLYWHLDRVHAWQQGKTIVPIYIEISPVSYCNHNCLFCGIDFAQQQKRTLDADLLCSQLDLMGKQGVRSVMFAGEGEPLLYSDLGRVVNQARRSAIDVSLTTNGMLGNEKIWREIIPNLSWLRFSIDAASSKVYSDVHRIAQNCFDKTLNSLQKAIEVRDKLGLDTTIGVQFLLIEENFDDVQNACTLFSELEVDYLCFKPYSEHPKMIRKSGYTYNEAIINKINDTVSSHPKNSKTEIIFRQLAADRYCSGIQKYDHCNALPFWGYISANGDFYTCSVFIGDERFGVGNINHNSISEIFNSRRRKASISYGKQEMQVKSECRINCRMARINEFLAMLKREPAHINFI